MGIASLCGRLQILKEARIHVLFGKRVDHVLYAALIGGFNRSEKDLLTLLVGPIDLKFMRINHRRKNLILVDIALFFGTIRQPIPKLRMGDVDQGHDPFTNGLAMDISNAVFGNHIMDITPGDRYPAARGAKKGTMRDFSPSSVVEGSVMIERPRRDKAAPRKKSTRPPPAPP